MMKTEWRGFKGNLSEADYLIGVYDENRMGGLRFSTSKGGTFLSDDKELATPPWTTLRKLESASLAFEKNDDGMEEKWSIQMCKARVQG